MPEPEPEKKEWVDWLNAKLLQKAVVEDQLGNRLAIRRVPTGPASRPNMWDLSGGSVSKDDLEIEGDPLIEAIKREVKEETGLEVTEVESIYTSSWKFTKSPGKILGVAIGYRCKVGGIKPQVVLSGEHYESLWGTKEEILALDFGNDGGLHRNIVEKS